MRAHENQADQQAGEKNPARRATPLGATADRMLALQHQAGNAAVSQVVQRRFDPEQHQHGAGCGHGGYEDSSPEGQVELLNAAKSTPGSPLSGSLRNEAESFYQTKFPTARIHDNPTVHRATAAMGAEAMTIGTDIFLGAGAAGRKDLIGHELDHVRNNQEGKTETGVDNGAGQAVTDPNQGSEVTAGINGNAFGAGAKVAPSIAQRAAKDRPDDEG
ncbi:DUF4157 domain-containing protein [Streptomyces parvulus]|uniref:DUF4157 domain-containing protein n=1 Tax=Streptomyces parvulus TaxID=146923 RepID=A0A369UY49_9ACTN|nr:DUF4157 domain-containing protein [Streptomyces parvulus]RDD85431.1 DUF4157 domain-containing protein [Streptomyces parvulus]